MTGKPAEAFHEAVATSFGRRVNRTHRWNAWQRVWWSEVSDIEDPTVISECLTAMGQRLNVFRR